MFNLLEEEKRRDENKRVPGQGVRKSLVQQLKREEGRKKYWAGNRKEGGRNNMWRKREKSTLLETQEAFKSQMGPLA